MEKQKASTYEYNGKREGTVSNERKEELKEKVNKIISKNESVALHKIFDIARTEEEYQFLFEYVEESGILLRGINASLAGEIKNYEHLPKDGQSYRPSILSHEETIRLFETKANGTEEEKAEARSELIEHNLRLVHWIVGTRMSKTRLGVERNDLISFGSEALIKAVDNFDFTRGTKFSTYAVGKIYWEIRNQILRHPRLVHVPVHIKERIMEVENTKEMLAEEKEKQGITTEVTPNEIASVTNLPLETVENVLKAIQSMELESIDDMLDDDYNEDLNAYMGDEQVTTASGYDITGSNPNAYGKSNSSTRANVDTIEEGILADREEPEAFVVGEDEVDRITFSEDIKEKMAEILDTLTPREEAVIRLRFGMEDGRSWSLEEVGRKYNVTQERIRQIEAKALRKLRHISRAKKIMSYAGEERLRPYSKATEVIEEPQEEVALETEPVQNEATEPVNNTKENTAKDTPFTTKELGDTVLTIFENIKNSYQKIEFMIQQKRQEEIQLRNMQAELSKEKQKLVEYISQLKALINANREMLEKMVQLETVLEALQKAEERLAQIEAEELEYQNQINRIIQERENKDKKAPEDIDI